MKRLATLLGFALFLLLPTSAAAADCQFVLGFATLRDLIGHTIVGECLENEHHSANGDGMQQTTGGLLVWRKADNRTAFTDGYRTWINGPNGLEQRLNTERFPWEPDYAPGGTPAPPSAPRPRPVRIDHCGGQDVLVSFWWEWEAGHHIRANEVPGPPLVSQAATGLEYKDRFFAEVRQQLLSGARV